jgi:hypothetical protein
LYDGSEFFVSIVFIIDFVEIYDFRHIIFGCVHILNENEIVHLESHVFENAFSSEKIEKYYIKKNSAGRKSKVAKPVIVK